MGPAGRGTRDGTAKAGNIRSDVVAEAVRTCNASSPAPISARPRAAVARFFDELELVPPGVVPLGHWAPGTLAGERYEQSDLPSYAALARKP